MSRNHGTIGGGGQNIVGGGFATVPGGQANAALGAYTLAAGYRAKATFNGSFVWADNTEADFTDTGGNQFLIRASGGVGIGIANPGPYKLAVAGGLVAYNNNNYDSAIYSYEPTISSNSANYYTALDLYSMHYHIPAGITDSGYRIGLSAHGMDYIKILRQR